MSDKFTRFEKPTSNQDFFNKAWQWLVVENRPQCASPIGGCLYREFDEDGEEKINGHTCVIGAFIPDELASGLAGTALGIKDSSGLRSTFEHVEGNLMLDVQRVHDLPSYFFNMYSRKEAMLEVARRFSLTIPEDKPKL